MTQLMIWPTLKGSDKDRQLITQTNFGLKLPFAYQTISFVIIIPMSKIVLVLLLALAVFCEKDYSDFVTYLRDNIQNKSGIFYHKAYERLAYLSDTWGPRMWGSSQLEEAIRELQREAITQGFDNVHLEAVKNFTKWVRGVESLTLYSPRPSPSPLKLIGLGGSVSGNVHANAIVVKSFDELESLKDQVKGKIVVYNEDWVNYGTTVQYRVNGASQAAKYGAVAALVKSVTPSSIESVHTGVQFYDSAYPSIPVAAITTEDAEMLYRMRLRNQTITLHLVMQNQRISNCVSYNLIFEIKGADKPDEILLMGGHIDSWDTGSQTGANDDGGGFITIFEAMRLILKNGFRPRRTLRFIAWSGEEWGDPLNGANQYARDHKLELAKHIVAFENDLGSTKLLGFGYNGAAGGMTLLKDIASKYLSIINASLINEQGHGADTSPLFSEGVPVMANVVQDTEDHKFYFTYHHSAGDSMSIMNADEMDSNVLGIAVTFFILADLEQTIPRAANLRAA